MKQIAIFLAAIFCVQAFYIPEDKPDELPKNVMDLINSIKADYDGDLECPSKQEESDEATLFPHPSDCTLYYECVWGSPILMECSPGLHFNPVLQTCDWPFQAGCKIPS